MPDDIYNIRYRNRHDIINYSCEAKKKPRDRTHLISSRFIRFSTRHDTTLYTNIDDSKLKTTPYDTYNKCSTYVVSSMWIGM